MLYMSNALLIHEVYKENTRTRDSLICTTLWRVCMYIKWINEPNAAARHGSLPAKKQSNCNDQSDILTMVWKDEPGLRWHSRSLCCFASCPAVYSPVHSWMSELVHSITQIISEMGTKLLLRNSNSWSCPSPTTPTYCHPQLLGSFVFGIWTLTGHTALMGRWCCV